MLFLCGAANYSLYPQLLLLGVSPPPGAVLVLHSLPLEFPLAMAFAEQLLSWKAEEGEGKSEDEPDTIPTSVLLQVVELLGEVLSKPRAGAQQVVSAPRTALANCTRAGIP